MQPTLRFVLPVYNEGEGAARAAEAVLEAAGRLGHPFHVTVYDDGSTDGLDALAAIERERGELRIVSQGENRGLGVFFRWCLGDAIRDAADGDLLLVLEGDGTCDTGMLPALVAAARNGADVAIASRYRPGGRVSGFPPGKALVSLFANRLLRFLYDREIRDWTMFYRIYKVGVLRALLARLPGADLATSGFATNAEILVRLGRMGCRIEEVPQHYRYGSKTGKSKLRIVPHLGEFFRLVVAVPPFVRPREFGGTP